MLSIFLLHNFTIYVLFTYPFVVKKGYLVRTMQRHFENRYGNFKKFYAIIWSCSFNYIFVFQLSISFSYYRKLTLHIKQSPTS